MSRNTKVCAWMEKKPRGKFHPKQSENLTGTLLVEQVLGIKAGENTRMPRILIEQSEPRQFEITESVNAQGKKRIIMEGEFGRVGVPTENGRVYPLSVTKKEIERLQPLVAKRAVWGEVEHPKDGRSSIERMSHVITSLELKESDGATVVWGKAELLDTPMGKLLAGAISAGIPIGVSSRGTGDTKPVDGYEEVQSNFTLKTYDFVAEPAMKTAIPEAVSESMTDQSVMDLLMEDFPEVVKAIQESKDSDTDNTVIDVDLAESFERKLKDALVGVRDGIAQELKESYESDPDIAGAKNVLASIAELVSAYKSEVNEDVVNDALRAKDIEIEESKKLIDSLTKKLKKAEHSLYVEQKVSKHPMSESIKKVMNGTAFDTEDELKEALDAVIGDLPKAEEIVTEKDALLREDNAKLNGQVAMLNSKMEDLKVKLDQAVKLGKRIEEQRLKDNEDLLKEIDELELKIQASSVVEASLRDQLEESKSQNYKLDKVAGLSNGRKLLSLMESVRDPRVVDKIVAEQGGLNSMSDPMLEEMRKSIKGKQHSKTRLEENDNVAGLGVFDFDGDMNMNHMMALAGIPSKGTE